MDIIYNELPEEAKVAGIDLNIEFVNPFILPDDCYVRNLDMISAYVEDAARMLSMRTKAPMDVCLSIVKRELGKGGDFELVDPYVEYLDSLDEGNRQVKVCRLSEYMADVERNQYILAATFTCYYNPNDKESYTARYAVREYANRKANKDLKLKYADLGDSIREGIYDNRQNRNKIKLNSLSGGHGTPSSALFMQSAHSTLTSTCRSGTSNTNATLERFLMGNRHYYDYDVVVQDIMAHLRITDLSLVEEAMEQYKLVYPTVDIVHAHILRSTSLYWTSKNNYYEDKIRKLLELLSPVQLAAYFYVNDMYALRQLNDRIARDLFKGLMEIPKRVKIPDAASWIKKLSGDDQALLGVTTSGRLSVTKLHDAANDDDLDTIATTAFQMYGTLNDYKLFFRAFWLTKNMPPNMADFPDSIRRVSIASDTDSAIFTTQQWVEWYFGELVTGPEGLCMAATVTYLCSQVTQHVLVQMTRNFGAVDKHIREFQMKNEYLFKFFSLTTMAKHYFASMNAQEGNIYPEDKLRWEIKGANLKNSKAPENIMRRSDELIKEVAYKVMNGEHVDLEAILLEVAEKEHWIINDIMSSGVTYFNSGQVKEAASYKRPDNPMFLNYPLWQTAFAHKYGECPPPPYAALKVNLDTTTPARVKAWLEEMEDQSVADGIRTWMKQYNKNGGITAIWIPKDAMDRGGVPAEIIPAINIRRILLDLLRSYYIVLECLGYYTINTPGITKLVSDLIDYDKLKEQKEAA